MSLLREKTHALVEDLLDQQMKENILQFLWWAEYANSVQAFQEFLDFLFVAQVQEVLEEIDSILFGEVTKMAESLQTQAIN